MYHHKATFTNTSRHGNTQTAASDACGDEMGVINEDDGNGFEANDDGDDGDVTLMKEGET